MSKLLRPDLNKRKIDYPSRTNNPLRQRLQSNPLLSKSKSKSKTKPKSNPKELATVSKQNNTRSRSKNQSMKLNLSGKKKPEPRAESPVHKRVKEKLFLVQDHKVVKFKGKKKQLDQFINRFKKCSLILRPKSSSNSIFSSLKKEFSRFYQIFAFLAAKSTRLAFSKILEHSKNERNEDTLKQWDDDSENDQKFQYDKFRLKLIEQNPQQVTLNGFIDSIIKLNNRQVVKRMILNLELHSNQKTNFSKLRDSLDRAKSLIIQARQLSPPQIEKIYDQSAFQLKLFQLRLRLREKTWKDPSLKQFKLDGSSKLRQIDQRFQKFQLVSQFEKLAVFQYQKHMQQIFESDKRKAKKKAGKSVICKIEAFLKQISNYLQFVCVSELIRKINNSYGNNSYLRYQKLRQKKKLSSEGQIILGDQVFDHFQKHMQKASKKENKEQKQMDSYHNKALFDMFNQHLNFFKPFYQLGGEPYPWECSQKGLTFFNISEENLQQVFQKTRQRVIEDCSICAGALIQSFQLQSLNVYCHNFTVQVKVNKFQNVQELESQKLGRIEQLEYTGLNRDWIKICDEKTVVMLAVAQWVQHQLLNELTNFIRGYYN